MHILVVEDERKVAQALKEGLEKKEYHVEIVFNGGDGFFKLNQQQFHLLILHVMLPGRDGFEILQTMQQKGMKIPVLILTVKDAVEDRVEGLDLYHQSDSKGYLWPTIRPIIAIPSIPGKDKMTM